MSVKLTWGQKNYQFILKRKIKAGAKNIKKCTCGLLFVGKNANQCTWCRRSDEW